VLAELDAVFLDAVACQEFLGTGVIYEDRTFYNEVRKLPPATITTFYDGRRVRQEQYWTISGLTPESLTAEQATDALWKSLTSAVTRITQRFDAIVSDLTGGYDSRSLAAALLHGQKKFATAVSGPADSADVVISRGLAAMLGLEHMHNPPSATPLTAHELQDVLELTDGEYDLVEYARVARIHRGLSRRFQISLNGSFGEVARGYWWELLFPHIGARRKLDSRKLAARRYALSSCSSLFQPQLRVNLVEHMAGVVDRTIAGLERCANTFQMDAAYLRMRMQRWQGRIASSTDRIWPCLSPFMFRPALETMLQARYSARERSLLARLMLAKYQPRLAAYPLEHGNPALPATWKNFPRFWPLLPYYAGKVVHKLSPGKTTPAQAGAAPNLRQQLWQMDEVRALLRPETMKSSAVLDAAALATFLDASRKPEFSLDAEWRRLLTLEWALARVRIYNSA
jgi:asparagine synthase (glutamine-hydrolysing)